MNKYLILEKEDSVNKKYLGKAVNLPTEVHKDLESVRKELEKQLGFVPSLSETIAFLIHSYREGKK